jgi:hypothetical protein
MRIASQKEKFYYLGAPGDLKNLSTAHLPMQLLLAWKLGYSVNSFTCHKMLVPHIQAIYAKISKLDPEYIKDSGMNIFSGCHIVRPIRGTEKSDRPPFSSHSWGAAVDKDNQRNGLFVKAPKANLSQSKFDPVHAIWRQHGFINMGHVIGRDYMHYEASFELISNPGKYL